MFQIAMTMDSNGTETCSGCKRQFVAGEHMDAVKDIKSEAAGGFWCSTCIQAWRENSYAPGDFVGPLL